MTGTISIICFKSLKTNIIKLKESAISYLCAKGGE